MLLNAWLLCHATALKRMMPLTTVERPLAGMLQHDLTWLDMCWIELFLSVFVSFCLFLSLSGSFCLFLSFSVFSCLFLQFCKSKPYWAIPHWLKPCFMGPETCLAPHLNTSEEDIQSLYNVGTPVIGWFINTSNYRYTTYKLVVSPLTIDISPINIHKPYLLELCGPQLNAIVNGPTTLVMGIIVQPWTQHKQLKAQHYYKAVPPR